ncbi:MAG: CBS domain-containing protein [Thaumarchaeota archaeon]|nr:CBS domain-containing protein [Nitrososphaerota archaeon]
MHILVNRGLAQTLSQVTDQSEIDMDAVKDFMTGSPITIDSSRSVHDAARLMTEKGVGCLIITANGKVMGIITERDLVSRVMAETFDPKKVLVGDVMTTPLFTITPSIGIDKAAETMAKYKVRRIPVVDNGTLVGIITANDLIRAFANKTNGERQILDVLTKQSKNSDQGPYR